MPYFYHPENGYTHEGGFIADQMLKAGWLQIDDPMAHKLSLSASVTESAPQESPQPNVHKTETEDCPVVAEPIRRKPGRPRKE